MKTINPVCRRLAETAVFQLRNGWLLVPVSVIATLAILRIGIGASSILVLCLVAAVLARHYRVTIRKRSNK